MPDCKTMYLSLFNKVTDAIELLQKAQLHTEEIYIESVEPTPLQLTTECAEEADKS